MVISVSGHAYPWDVIGDPAFADRVAGHGLATVTLAAAYHSARAATPLHPRHQIVDAGYAALYRPIRDAVWRSRRLRPWPPDWVSAPDPFGAAAGMLRAAGLRVSAWIVLTHNTGLGSVFDGLAVTNCFGDRYPYALCPAQQEVCEYAATLAGEAVTEVPVDGVSLEACGQLGLSHNSHHEKTDGAWTQNAMRLLSVCCCAACKSAWRERGLDPAEVIVTLRAAVRAEAEGAEGTVPKQMAAELLAARHRATDRLRAAVLEQVTEQAPGVPVTLHGHPDPWATGPSPGLTATAAGEVDAVLVPAWPTGPATADDVALAARAAAEVDAYVTVLPPAEPEALGGHVRRLVAAGASRLSLYHLGLASRRRQPLFQELVKLAGELG